MLRGAPIRDEERNELNLEARKLFESHGIDIFDYDKLREIGSVGYVQYYLFTCWDKSELKNNADVAIYMQLLEIDAKLGTSQTEQLFWCLTYSPRMDLIKV